MNTYANPLPIDRNGREMQEYPAPKISLQTVSGAPAASSLITLNSNTTVIEVGAVAAPVIIKWFGAGAGNPSVTASNFDHHIPANTYRRFVIPQSVIGTGATNNFGAPSIAGLNTQEGLFPTMAIKAFAAGAPASVLTSEF